MTFKATDTLTMKSRLLKNRKPKARVMLAVAGVSSFFMSSAFGATLNLGASVATFVSGSGTAANGKVGDVNLYSNIGTDGNGHSFDALLTVNNMSSSTAILDTTKNDAFIHVSGTSDVWVDVTLSFIVSGSSTMTVPLGTPVSLTGVTSFVAKDIDSANTTSNFTDVFGLYNSPGTPTLGSKLQSGGFVGADTNPSVPTTGVDYVRATPASTGPLNWTSIDNAATSDANYFSTWNYAGDPTKSEFRFVWGFTSEQTGGFAVNNRGMLASVNFTGDVVPEPSQALLLLVGLTGGLLRRKR